MRSLSSLLLFALLACLTTGSGAASCIEDRERLLSLDVSSFDQDLDGGWRRVAAMPHCREAAADLIEEYRSRRDERDITLIFHEAQVRAGLGQTERAIALFEQTRKSPERDSFGWNHYVEATIAFPKRDREALERSRDALAGLEAPEDFRPVDQAGNELDISWPPNLEVVDGFLKCFNRPYSAAYGCRD
ncbi:hypothetical protein [Wenzhouxiangella sediminis]|uniref:hypothetical protein n=1 Tax=Wenzhouxiangella sediminis TaxID=1792836 RepID=UPI0011C0522E|nr:hypothetical protein [Wenzhouxiangella sediminis]